MGRFIYLFFFFFGGGGERGSKDIGRIKIKGSQIRREFGKLHFSSLLLVILHPYLFFKDQFVGEINLFCSDHLVFSPMCSSCSPFLS